MEKIIKKTLKQFLNERVDKLRGGLADDATIEKIAQKHGVQIEMIRKESEMGIKVEMEHTNDPVLAKEIAMDHLMEIPDYYSRLKKLEVVANKKWGK